MNGLDRMTLKELERLNGWLSAERSKKADKAMRRAMRGLQAVVVDCIEQHRKGQSPTTSPGPLDQKLSGIGNIKSKGSVFGP